MVSKKLQSWEINGTADFINIGDGGYQLGQVTEKGTNAAWIEPFSVKRGN
jgi:hypothetical protein